MSSTPTCRHVLANGALCQAASLRNRDYCRFHLQQVGRRMRAARMRARHQAPLLRLPLLEDLYSVQVALMQLADAIAYREIEPQYARLLTTVLRLAMQNLKSTQWDRPPRFQLAETGAAPTAWDSFERDHDLPAGLDLSLDPDLAFPPPENAVPQVRDLPLGANLGKAPCNASFGLSRNDDVTRERIHQILRDAETPVPGASAHVTADEVEIMDVYEREGNDAMMQVITEQQRNRRRRERRARRLYYEEVARNRNIRSAARKLVEEQGKALLQPPSPRVRVADEVAQVEAAFTRKAPQGVTAAQIQEAATAEV